MANAPPKSASALTLASSTVSVIPFSASCTAPTARLMVSVNCWAKKSARAVRVRGAVTLNGAALPESTMRGALRFQGPSPAVGGVDLALPSSGAGAYAVTLIAGAYTALHSGALACDATRPSTVPCGAQALAGCTAP